ncbi:MFS transporter [Arthrobacter sp. D3-16]
MTTPDTSRKQRLSLAGFVVAVAFTVLSLADMSKFNVAIPDIRESTGATPTQLQLIVSGYILAFGLTLIPAGRLGDVRSRRGLLLLGMALYTLSSLACAVSPTLEVLVLSRLAQGVGAGLQSPQIIGLIQGHFTGPERGRAYGAFGALVGVATGVGPALGGAILSVGGGNTDNWRLLFWANVPIGALGLIVTLLLVPRGTPRPRKATMDPLGLLLLGATIVAFMLPVILTTGAPEDSPLRWICVAVGFLAAYSFIRWEKSYSASGRQPLVPMKMLQLPTFRRGILVASLFNVAMAAGFIVVMMFLQETGVDPVSAGIATVPFALTSAVTSAAIGRRIDKSGPALIVAGVAVMMLGYALVAISAVLAPHDLRWIFITGSLALAGAGGGAVAAPSLAVAMRDTDAAFAGVAGSVVQTGQRLGTAVGASLGIAAYFFLLQLSEPGTPVLDTHRLAISGTFIVLVAILLLSLLIAWVGLLSPAGQRVGGRMRSEIVQERHQRQ